MSTNALRSSILVGLFAIPFIPLVVSKTLLFPFITGKAFLFRVIVEIIVALWLGLCLASPEYRPKFSWISIAVLLFTIVIGIADFFGVNPTKSFWSNFERMEGFVSLLHFAGFYFVLTSTVKSKDLWNKLFGTSVFVSLIMSVYSLLQLAGKIVINQGGVRVDGTFGNATYLGIYMVFNIFLAAYLFLNTKNIWNRWMLGIVALLNVIVLYHTATRGAILGFLGGAVLTFIVFLVKSDKGDKIRKFALISIVAVFALVGVFLISRNNSYIRNNPVLGRFATLSFAELKTQGRYFVWPIAWKGFLERPILGWGQEGFNFVFNENYNPKMYNQEPWFDRTHNIVLDWLIAGGIVGFAAYAFILLSLIRVLFKRANISTKEKAVFFGVIAAYCFHNLFVFDQIGSYILFFSILAFVSSLSSETTPEWAKKIGTKFAVLTKESLQPVSASLIVIIFVYAMYALNYVPWQENKAIIKVLSASAQGVASPVADYRIPLAKNTLGFSEAVEHVSTAAIKALQSNTIDQKAKEELFVVVNDAFKKQISIAPTDARYRLFYGTFLSQAGDIQGALNEFAEAVKYAPNKQSVYFEYAGTLFSVGRKEEALAEFKKAYELEPSHPEARYVYGLVALSVGQTSLANELLSGFEEDKLVFDDRYISVLAGLGQYNQVIAIINKRIEREPTNLQYRLSLAAAYLQSNQRALAVNVIREMITLDPSFKQTGEYYITEIQAGRNP